MPKGIAPAFDVVVQCADSVCREHLTEEYAEKARELLVAMARKRPSPLARGRAATWACGAVYALGAVNFLFDRTQTPHMRAGELCVAFGVSPSAGSAKSREIMAMFQMVPLDPRWCLPSRLKDNPLAWMVEVNGLVVDVRMLPEQVQAEAYRRGLIPFLPGDLPNQPLQPTAGARDNSARPDRGRRARRG